MAATTNLDITLLEENQSSKYATVNSGFEALEDLLTEFVELDVTSGNVTVTAGQVERNQLLRVTGAGTAGRTVTLPAQKRLLAVESVSTNTETVTVQTGSTTASLAPGKTIFVYTDGTANGMTVVSGGAASFAELSDGPGALSGNNFEYVRVNSGATALEYVPLKVEASGQRGTIASTDVIFEKVVGIAFTIPSGASESRAYARTAPSGGVATFNINKNGALAGTFEFADATNTATFTVGSNIVLAAGDRISVEATSTLNSIASMTVTLVGNRTA